MITMVITLYDTVLFGLRIFIKYVINTYLNKTLLVECQTALHSDLEAKSA